MIDLAIDDATLDAAERLLGVRYTDAERAQMRDNLAEQIELAVRRRAVKLPNALPPATLFDPRLPGFTMPAQATPNIPRNAPALPVADVEIAFAPVRHLSAWIAGGQLSSVRLTRIYLERIRRHDPTLFSFAMVTDSVALAQAERADALLAAGTWRGPLHGVPYGAKDVLDTAGITTGWGAEPFAHRVPETDAEVIRRLAAAGAVLLGKTSVGSSRLWRRLVWWADAQSVEHGRRIAWIKRRVRIRHGCGSRRVRDWHGNTGLDRRPLRPLRHRWPAPHLRPRLACGGNGTVLVAR